MIHIPENKRNVPSLFTCLDGTEVKTAEDWTGKRRPDGDGIDDWCSDEICRRVDYYFTADYSLSLIHI